VFLTLEKFETLNWRDERRSDFGFALCWELKILFLICFLRIMFVKESKFWCHVIDFEFLCFY